MRRRNEIQQEEARNEEDLIEENHEARSDINNKDTNNNVVVDEPADKLTADHKELKRFFQIQIEAIDHCSLLQLAPCEKLAKETEVCVNRVLGRYLIDVNIIPEITDKVYAMGKVSHLN